ncbi:RTA1 like protein-domain-containing protein [Penicillium macrosclerotiorum]|uniref:RTA1 like protein-domain-containing protein n=1 Tax=Penicillium macrosclerotiorum TaxID=303699 RepID=UPI002546EF7C|nr:RTA1 like protein-domain-containing protein [Penicillium macrosclerotiorum]KAJ5698456.1 RTA1 like protein-domain-containing protein [Penicillium macrosclerotiorum]
MASYALYQYTPSLAAAVIALICYGASSGYHIYQMIKLRCYFFSTFIAGALMMTLGYALRAISSRNTTSLGPYIGQSICLLLPPSLYAATIYMIYGRIVRFARAPELSIISPQKVTKVFVIGDVLAFLAQASGGGMMAISSMSSLGQKVIVLGLIVQLLFFGGFLTISLIFYRRIRARSTFPIRAMPFGNLLFVLFGASALIILRCFYRIIEFCQGNEGYLISHEVFMYLFDTIPMLIVQIMFHYYHPGKILQEKFYGDLGAGVGV